MSYEEYAKWCEFRRVEPITKEAFEKEHKPTLQIVIKDDVETTPAQEFNIQQLRKTRKSDLVDLCAEFNVCISENDTKKQLVNKLLSLNNS